MGYRRHLLRRWSRRDALAVLVVVVAVAFLTGTTLVVLAAGAQTTSMAKEYTTEGHATFYPTVSSARTAADGEAVVLPTATVEGADGTDTRVVGVACPQATSFDHRSSVTIPCPPESGGVTGDVASETKRVVRGRDARLSLSVRPRHAPKSVLPPRWYVANESVVERLGTTGAFVVEPASAASSASVPPGGVPLRSALAFFLAGMRQVVTVLGLTAAGTGVLVGVTVYGVTRMHTYDRRRTIFVARATGDRPTRIRRLYALRSGALTAIGTALGYAVGVVLPRTAVNAAVYLHMPTSLSIRVSPRAAAILLPLYGVVVVIGAFAGYLAARACTRGPPVRSLSPRGGSGWSARLADSLSRGRSLALLDWRILVPSVAPLAAFCLVVVLVASIAGVVTPMVRTGGTTVAQPGASHPIDSRVPESYATALRDHGTAASPEILAFAVRDGRPMLVRGANYGPFERVSNATLVRGRRPDDPGEAVIGTDLARTLGVTTNDSLTLGGSTVPGVTRVEIVGEYRAPGPFDDQLVVSLETARHLARVDRGMVQVIRTTATVATDRDTAVVVGVSTPERVPRNATVPVRVQVENLGSSRVTRTLTVEIDGRTRATSVKLGPHEHREVAVRVRATRLGRHRISVGGQTRSIRVVPRDAIELRGLPPRAPPGSTPLVSVLGVGGAPVSDATVSVGGRTVRTGSNGTARVRLDATGNATVRAAHGGRTARETVTVSRDAPRSLSARVRVRPSKPSLLTRPTALLTLTNPWNDTLSKTVTLVADGERTTRRVTLEPGARTTVTVGLGRQPPGSHTVRVTADGRELGTATYRVTGDDRIATALASGGASGETGIGRAISTAFGNLNLLVAVFVCLAGLMTVGSTTATVAYTVHSRRRVFGVHRATGASPFSLLRTVLVDAAVVGAVATVVALALALGVLALLANRDLLVLYGIRIPPVLTPRVIAGAVVGGVGVMCLSAVLAVAALTTVQPGALLSALPRHARDLDSGGDGDD